MCRKYDALPVTKTRGQTQIFQHKKLSETLTVFLVLFNHGRYNQDSRFKIQDSAGNCSFRGRNQAVQLRYHCKLNYIFNPIISIVYQLQLRHELSQENQYIDTESYVSLFFNHFTSRSRSYFLKVPAVITLAYTQVKINI